jgi:hypothetical protein
MNPKLFDSAREKITPEHARQLLLLNKRNRPMDFHHVRVLAREMQAGHWKFNGDSIRISTANNILDGQHRLHAIITSGVTIECLIVRGLPDDAFDTIDVGKKRTGGDIFFIKGEKDCNVLAAALQLVHGYYDNRLTPRKTYPITVLEEALILHPAIRNSVTFAKEKKAKLLPQSACSALHYLFSEKDKLLADIFIESLATGTGLRLEDTIWLLRERLIKNLSDRAKLPTHYIMALAIKTWNAERKGRKMRGLSWRGGEDSPEACPEIL